MRRVGFLLGALAFALGGCGWGDGGSTRKYGECRASLVNQGLSQDAARAYCVVANEQAIKADIKGSAAYRDTPEGVAFQGRVRNPSTNDVLTGFSIKVEHPAAGKSETLRLDRLWIEPGASFDFSVPQSGLAYVPPPERRGNPSTDGSRWTWDVVEPRGLGITP